MTIPLDPARSLYRDITRMFGASGARREGE